MSELQPRLATTTAIEDAAVRRCIDAAGLELLEHRSVTHYDIYIDSDRRDLLGFGAALRLRRVGDERLLGFRNPDGEGVVEQAWTSEHLPATPSSLPEALRMHVEPLAFGRSLGRAFELETHCQRYVLKNRTAGDPAGGEAELRVDNVQAHWPAGLPAAFARVGLGVRSGTGAAFSPLLDRLRTDLHLEPSQQSTVEQALSLHEGQAPMVPTEVTGKMSLHRAATCVFHKRFRETQLEEPGTRLGEEPEALHRMRVANRRLAAAFNIFGSAFAPQVLDRFKPLLRRNRRALGPVRDIDVLLATIPALAERIPADIGRGIDDVVALLTEERERQRQRMLRWLTSQRRLRASERLQLFIEREAEREAARGRSGLLPSSGLRVREAAPGLILVAAKRVFRRGARIDSDSPPEHLHDLRIGLKHLRYTLEPFEDAYPKVRRFRRRLTSLQDLLGEYNDAHVAALWLGRWPAQRRRIPADASLAIGALVGLQTSRREVARTAFLRAWRKLDQKRWRRDLLDALV